MNPLTKQVGFISFSTVRFAYRGHSIFHSPLLEPVDKIEDRLRDFGYIQPNQHLSDYDTIKEGFNIVVYSDGDKQLSWLDRLRFKVAKFIVG